MRDATARRMTVHDGPMERRKPSTDPAGRLLAAAVTSEVTMRDAYGILFVIVAGGMGIGCADKGAADPGTLLREETVNRVGAPSRATSRTVRCGCDADGELHVRAPHGSEVRRPEDGTYPAEAEIVLAEDPPPARLRHSKSLGFIGDSKLTPSPSRGGPWAVPDALLPPHAHVEPRYGGGGSWGYRGGSYGAYGAYSVTPAMPGAPASASPGVSGSVGSPPSAAPGPAGGPSVGPGWR